MLDDSASEGVRTNDVIPGQWQCSRALNYLLVSGADFRIKGGPRRVSIAVQHTSRINCTMAISVGDAFPTDITPKYIPYSDKQSGVAACGAPQPLDLAKEFAGKKVVITAAPGAFTPTCTELHIPDYLKHADQFKAKGVSRVIVLTANDFFTLSAWSKVLGNKDPENYVVFATDPNVELLTKLGPDFIADLSSAGFGTRTSRWTVLVDDGKVKFIGTENGLGFSEISSAETILSKI